jgi:hypothetical protein
VLREESQGTNSLVYTWKTLSQNVLSRRRVEGRSGQGPSGSQTMTYGRSHIGRRGPPLVRVGYERESGDFRVDALPRRHPFVTTSSNGRNWVTNRLN